MLHGEAQATRHSHLRTIETVPEVVTWLDPFAKYQQWIDSPQFGHIICPHLFVSRHISTTCGNFDPISKYWSQSTTVNGGLFSVNA